MDKSTLIEETLEALHDVVKVGKARCLGAASMHAWKFSKVLRLQRQHSWTRLASMQGHYNLLAREDEVRIEREPPATGGVRLPQAQTQNDRLLAATPRLVSRIGE